MNPHIAELMRCALEGAARVEIPRVLWVTVYRRSTMALQDPIHFDGWGHAAIDKWWAVCEHMLVASGAPDGA